LEFEGSQIAFGEVVHLLGGRRIGEGVSESEEILENIKILQYASRKTMAPR